MDNKSLFRKLDLFTIAVLALLGLLAFWMRGQYVGWLFLCFALHFMMFDILCLRFGHSFFAGSALSILICTAILIVLAMLISMKHPPLIGGPDDWARLQQPFNNFRERIGDAILLSIWQIFVAPFAVLLSLAYAVFTRDLLFPETKQKSKTNSGADVA